MGYILHRVQYPIISLPNFIFVLRPTLIYLQTTCLLGLGGPKLARYSSFVGSDPMAHHSALISYRQFPIATQIDTITKKMSKPEDKK
jgi:hypothetical protein